jgi:VanZ family protein
MGPSRVRQSVRIWLYWLPVLAYAGLIFWLSSQSRPPGPTIWLLQQLGDKVLHAIEYGIMGILCFRAFRHAAGTRAARSALLLAVAAATVYGVTDEIHQVFVPMREPDALDVVMDFIGAVIGASGWRLTVDPAPVPSLAP